jgi:hypothetical protein
VNGIQSILCVLFDIKAGQIINGDWRKLIISNIFVIHTPIIGKASISKQLLHEIDKVNKLIKNFLICLAI